MLIKSDITGTNLGSNPELFKCYVLLQGVMQEAACYFMPMKLFSSSKINYSVAGKTCKTTNNSRPRE